MQWVKKLAEYAAASFAIPSLDEMSKTLDPEMFAEFQKSVDKKIAAAMKLPVWGVEPGEKGTVAVPITDAMAEWVKDGNDNGGFSIGFDPGVDMGSTVSSVLPGGNAIEFSSPLTVKMPSLVDSASVTTTVGLDAAWEANAINAALKKALDAIKECIGIKEINLHHNYSAGALPNMELNLVLVPTEQAQVTTITGWAFDVGAPKGIGKLK